VDTKLDCGSLGILKLTGNKVRNWEWRLRRGFSNGCSEAAEPSDLRRRSVRSTKDEEAFDNGDEVVRGGVELGRGAIVILWII